MRDVRWPKFYGPWRPRAHVDVAAGWLLLDARRNVIRFDASGRLLSIADALATDSDKGNRMEFFHDGRGRLERVHDTLEREIEFEYAASGQLTRIRDFSGREFEYLYDPDGRLREFRTPAVLTESSPTVPEALVITYAHPAIAGDLADRLNLRDNMTSMTDAKGQTWLELVYTDADADGRAEEVTGQTWGSHALSIAYDFALRQTTVTDGRSNVCR